MRLLEFRFRGSNKWFSKSSICYADKKNYQGNEEPGI